MACPHAPKPHPRQHHQPDHQARWCISMPGHASRHTFRNLVGHVKNVARLIAPWLILDRSSSSDPRLTWERCGAWVRRQVWGVKLIFKGIMEAEDARAGRDKAAPMR